MPTKKTAEQIDILIDTDGTKYGTFNPNGDPFVSHMRMWTGEPPTQQPDQWVLSYQIGGIQHSFNTDVSNEGAVAEATAKAIEHLEAVGFTPRPPVVQFGDEPESNGW
jgi:hypothetical protein